MCTCVNDSYILINQFIVKLCEMSVKMKKARFTWTYQQTTLFNDCMNRRLNSFVTLMTNILNFF